MTADLVDDDKCRVMKDTVVKSWRNFCTTRGGDLDQGLLTHVLDRLKVWASDRCPAIMKAARLLRETECRKCAFVMKDPCHMLRATTQVITQSFDTAETILFGEGDKTGVIPSITNSWEWQCKFLWVQKVVVEHQGGAFASALQAAAFLFKAVKVLKEAGYSKPLPVHSARRQ